MLMQFNGNGTPSGVAILAASNFKGTVVVQGSAPFWLGNSKQALEQLGPPPPGGSNIELRDGFYINQNLQGPGPGPSSAPISILGWNGDVWILNGKGPLDQPNNVVEVQCFGC